MSHTPMTVEAARQKISEIFVYHMPFNRELGLELRHFDDDYTRHTSSCMCVGFPRSPQSLTGVSSWGLSALPPSCNSNYLVYMWS